MSDTPTTRFERTDFIFAVAAGGNYGPIIDCRDLQQLSVHNKWTGTIAGTFYFLVANDPQVLIDPDPLLVPYLAVAPEPVFGNPTPIGAPGTNGYVIRDLFRFARSLLVVDSGAGSWTSWLNARKY